MSDLRAVLPSREGGVATEGGVIRSPPRWDEGDVDYKAKVGDRVRFRSHFGGAFHEPIDCTVVSVGQWQRPYEILKADGSTTLSWGYRDEFEYLGVDYWYLRRLYANELVSAEKAVSDARAKLAALGEAP